MAINTEALVTGPSDNQEPGEFDDERGSALDIIDDNMENATSGAPVTTPDNTVVDDSAESPEFTASEAGTYEDLSNLRANTDTPDFSGYEQTADVPTHEDGSTYNTAETTVQHQLEKILQEGSPLDQVTKANAREQAAALGMGSSSMAIGATQRALIESALPIAQQDAKTAAAFKQAEQTAKSQQINIQTEAQVSGDLNLHKAKLAEEQKKLDDSFTIALKGLDTKAAQELQVIQEEYAVQRQQMTNNLQMQLQQMQVNATMQTTIMNNAAEMMNDYQATVMTLMQDKEWIDGLGEGGMKHQFNNLFDTVSSSITLMGQMSGLSDPINTYVAALIRDNRW